MSQTKNLTIENVTESVFNDLSRTMASMLIVIGDQLDLFKLLHKHNHITVSTFAEISGYNESYLSEWLLGCNAAGYLHHNSNNDTYSITDEVFEVLGKEEGDYFLQGVFNQMFPLWFVLDDVMSAFKNGGGVSFDKYDARLWEGIDRETIITFKNSLGTYIGMMPEIHEKLTKGANVADIGCGRGGAIIEMAKLYPKSNFYGYDLHQPSLEFAISKAEEEGVVTNTSFKPINVLNGLPHKFDLVTAFDVVHDLENPSQVLRSVYDALNENGVFFIRDFKLSGNSNNQQGNYPTMLYGFSLMYCKTTALVHDNRAVGTLGISPDFIRETSQAIGYSEVEELFVEDDGWIIGYKITK